MEKLSEIFKNKWVKFGIIAAIYVLFVIWLRSPLWLLGLIIIFDIYITKKVHWAFWKPRNEKPTGFLGWVDAIIFALVAVTIINTFFVQAYTIPTSSMEKSLLVGDYLFVSKVSYGPRIPNTPLSLPLVHNTIFGRKSYSELIHWKYKRLAGFGNIERNDVVVFNFPHGDTVAVEYPANDYHLFDDAFKKTSQIITRPVDKKDNYVKRCVAISGDSLQVIDGTVYINGKPQIVIPRMQYNYSVQTNGTPINTSILDKLDVAKVDRNYSSMPLTEQDVQEIKKLPNIISVDRITAGYDEAVFPRSKYYKWSIDNFGPIWIPKKGATVELTLENLPIYREIIDVYEENDLRVDGGTIYINGQAATSYTFKMNYYWMMGDNRHNSLDSRYFGYVPEDHVVGKAWFIWFSSNKDKSFPGNIRWNRMFKFVK